MSLAMLLLFRHCLRLQLVTENTQCSLQLLDKWRLVLSQHLSKCVLLIVHPAVQRHGLQVLDKLKLVPSQSLSKCVVLIICPVMQRQSPGLRQVDISSQSIFV